MIYNTHQGNTKTLYLILLPSIPPSVCAARGCRLTCKRGRVKQGKPALVLQHTHTHTHTQGMPALLSQVLQDSSIRKVGVGLAEDAAKLLADWGAEVVSCVDLACAAKAEGLTHLTSLAKCSLHLLGLAMCKNKKIRMGNWERLPLSPAQVMNAIHYYNNIKYIVYLINLYTKTLFTSLRTRRWMRGLLPKGLSDSRRHPSPVDYSTRVG